MTEPSEPKPADDTAVAEVGGDLQAALARYVGSTAREWRLLLAEAEKKHAAAAWKPEGERDAAAGLLEFTRSMLGSFERLGTDGPPKHDHLTPADFTWHDVTVEWRRDEAAGRALMDRIKGAARDELAAGRTAAAAVEGYMPRPMERAEYMAVAAELADGLRPANGTERLLVDGMAQALVLHRRWLHKAALTDSMEVYHLEKDARSRGEWQPPRIGETAYVDRALATADWFMKAFLRLLKAYRDQRRVLGTLVVAGGQVNIAGDGGQQVVAARVVRGAEGGRPRANPARRRKGRRPR